jgi:hypothetical protein
MFDNDFFSLYYFFRDLGFLHAYFDMSFQQSMSVFHMS